MKKIMRWVLMLVLIGGASAAGYWYYTNKVAASASQADTSGYSQVVTVTKGNLNSALSVVGSMEAVQSADLAFEHLSSTTRLASLDIQAGNTVTAGQVLAAVDPAPYRQAVDQATSDLAAAEKTLADLAEPATALEIAQADLAISQAEYELQSAQDTLDKRQNPDIDSLRATVAAAQSALAKAQADVVAQQETTSSKAQLNKLLTAEATPAADYARLAAETYTDDYYEDRLAIAYNKMIAAQDARLTYQVQAEISALQAQMAVRQDQKQLAEAQAALAQAQAGGDKVTLAAAQVALQEAQVALQTAQDARTTLDEGSDSTQIATARADVDKKRLALSDAQSALDGTRLVAPFDGTVLSTGANAGDLISANDVVLSLANLKTLQVVASVDETTIRRVSAGQDAAITFDAFPGQTFTGQVLGVPLQGSLQGGVTVYDVPLSLSGAEAVSLLVGMTANVEIRVAQVSDALLVPTLALQLSDGQYSVLVPNPADPTAQPDSLPVEIGLSDGTYTQITKGLNPGDKIVAEIAAVTTYNNFGNRGGGNSLIMQTSRTLSGR